MTQVSRSFFDMCRRGMNRFGSEFSDRPGLAVAAWVMPEKRAGEHVDSRRLCLVRTERDGRWRPSRSLRRNEARSSCHGEEDGRHADERQRVVT